MVLSLIEMEISIFVLALHESWSTELSRPFMNTSEKVKFNALFRHIVRYLKSEILIAPGMAGRKITVSTQAITKRVLPRKFYKEEITTTSILMKQGA